MRVVYEQVELEFYEDEGDELAFASRKVRARGQVGITKNVAASSFFHWNLVDPMSLVATVAHELGHVRLLSEASCGSWYLALKEKSARVLQFSRASFAT